MKKFLIFFLTFTGIKTMAASPEFTVSKPQSNSWFQKPFTEVEGHSPETGTTYHITVYESSNGTITVSYKSNLFFAGNNFNITDVELLTNENRTNWIEISAVKGNSTNTKKRIPVMYALPKIISWKTFDIAAPISGGYNGNLTDLVPGTAVKITVFISNTGRFKVNNIETWENIDTSSLHVLNHTVFGELPYHTFSNDTPYTPSGGTTWPYVNKILFEAGDLQTNESKNFGYVVVIK